MTKLTKTEQFVKPEDITKTGTTFTILEEPKEYDGQFGKELVTRVKMQNGENIAKAKWRINNTSKDILIDALGDESEEWIGKTVSVEIQNIANKDAIIVDKTQF